MGQCTDDYITSMTEPGWDEPEDYIPSSIPPTCTALEEQQAEIIAQLKQEVAELKATKCLICQALLSRREAGLTP